MLQYEISSQRSARKDGETSSIKINVNYLMFEKCRLGGFRRAFGRMKCLSFIDASLMISAMFTL